MKPTHSTPYCARNHWRTPPILSKIVGSVALISVSIFASACASSASTTRAAVAVAPVVAPAPPPATKEASEERTAIPADARRVALAFSVHGGDATASRFADLLRASFVREGYWLVDRESATTNGRLEVTIKPTSVGDDASSSEMEISVALISGSATIEWLVTQASSDFDKASLARVDDLVQRLSGSPRFSTFAKSVSVNKALRGTAPMTAQAGPSQPTGAEASASREETLWSESALRRCRNGRHADACDKIRAYVDLFPNGAHAANAKAALELTGRRTKSTRAAVAAE